MFSEEAAITNIIFFGFIGLGFQPTIYSTPDKHAKHYTTNTILTNTFIMSKWVIKKQKYVIEQAVYLRSWSFPGPCNSVLQIK